MALNIIYINVGGEEQGLRGKRGYQPAVRQVVPHTATLQRHDAILSPAR